MSEHRPPLTNIDMEMKSMVCKEDMSDLKALCIHILFDVLYCPSLTVAEKDKEMSTLYNRLASIKDSVGEIEREMIDDCLESFLGVRMIVSVILYHSLSLILKVNFHSVPVIKSRMESFIQSYNTYYGYVEDPDVLMETEMSKDKVTAIAEGMGRQYLGSVGTRGLDDSIWVGNMTTEKRRIFFCLPVILNSDSVTVELWYDYYSNFPL